MTDDEMRKLTIELRNLAEKKLTVFTAILAEMTPSNLAAYRAYALGRQDGSPDEAMMLEIIDGHIALRQLQR